VAFYLFGLVLQVIGLGVTFLTAIYFFDSSFGMGKLLQLFAVGVVAFGAGRVIMRPYRSDAP